MIVFRVHFGAEPGYTKKDNEGDSDGSAIIDSPFIRFVEQVCDELNITKSNGEPYTRATFADAVRKARKL